MVELLAALTIPLLTPLSPLMPVETGAVISAAVSILMGMVGGGDIWGRGTLAGEFLCDFPSAACHMAPTKTSTLSASTCPAAIVCADACNQ